MENVRERVFMRRTFIRKGEKGMKILLAAINAKYIHSNLAVYSLKAYAEEILKQKWQGENGTRVHRDELPQIELAEYTINNRVEEILKSIYKKKPDVIAFSCYIWNIHLVDELIVELKKLLPDTPIWVGGPEVSYNAREQLLKKPQITGVMMGEGEETFAELAEYYWMRENTVESCHKELVDIKGIVFRQNEEILENDLRPQLDMSTIPFPYKDMKDLEHKIVYYESSRGCPYSCSYCLSSIDKKLRFRDIELVKEELQYFLDCKVPQVKFVDRTFNCKHEHAMAIWKFIKEQDNGITNFHFEISADLLRKEEIELVKGFRPGLAQFEIGVQSVHGQTIEAIHRKMNLEKLNWAVKQVQAGANIHQHLDLIAGLPYEDYETFKKSFDYVYGLKPDQLQLGFLKVLKGAAMATDSKEYGIVFRENSPYEVLFTNWISYEEILELKKVEEMVELYYNSGQFTKTIAYLEHFFESPFALYHSLGCFYEEKGLSEVSHSRLTRYYIMLDWCKKKEIGDIELIKELMLYDLYLRENLKSRPSFVTEPLEEKEKIQELYRQEENMKELLPHYSEYNWKQISRMTHTEVFHYDLEAAVCKGETVPKTQYLLFDYEQREPLHNQGMVYVIKEEV